MELLWEALRDLSLVAGSACQPPSPDHPLQSLRSTNNHACPMPTAALSHAAPRFRQALGAPPRDRGRRV